MKYLICISFAVVCIALCGCKDSLGIDPNVVKIGDITDDTIPKPDPIIKINDVALTLSEFYRFDYTTGYCIAELPWQNFCKMQEKIVELDTGSVDYVLRIKSLKIKSILADSVYDHVAVEGVIDKVVYSELKIDSIPLINGYERKLDSDPGGGNYCMIRTETIETGALTDFTGESVDISYKVSEVNKEGKYIVLDVKSTLSEEFNYMNYFNFQIIINY